VPPSLSPSEQAAAICDACATGTLEDLKAILPAGEDAFTLANTQHPRSGLMPLHLAASRGSVAHCAYLLDECGALVDCEDPSGETAVQKAANRGHLQMIRLLVNKAGAEIIESADSDGWVALHNAASKGYLDIVRLLCDLGASVDRQSKLGYTPLMCAASRGHAVVVRYLLARPLIDVFLRNSHGETAYDVRLAVLNLADRFRRPPTGRSRFV
jgi:ankyrin repeat protein